jgi:AcrR family transcriptional regulator
MTQAVDTRRDTKERILDAAETLFADQGFAATSLRQITSEANVNLAAVNYHFQSKESLLLAVMRRKIEPINARRIALLDGLESKLPDETPPVWQVVRAFLLPVFEAPMLGVDLGSFPRLMGRVLTEPGGIGARLVLEGFGTVVARFNSAIRRACPGLTQEDLAWGFMFSMGAMAHCLAGGALLAALATHKVDMQDEEEVLERMVNYMTAGIEAMATAKRRPV